MKPVTDILSRVYLAIIPVSGVLVILSVPQYLGTAIVAEEAVSFMLGVSIAAAFLRYPYRREAGIFELLLGFAALAAWLWSAAHYEAWIVGMADRTPDKWVPGIVAIVLMMEALRKSCGRSITILVWTLIAYGLLGHHLPGVIRAFEQPPTKLILYLYADSNGIPGLVLRIIATLVLGFIVLGKLMEVSGATRFFNDLAMSWMGHRRGGPAKVAVVASSAFGMISGSTVANIMSTGIVTIPLMKRSGFQPHYAAAVEAVASNGGQIAPPVMGATAFLIAEFLQISYAEVVIAAAVPAALYYFALFLQVDAIAARFGLSGLPRDELPRTKPVLLSGWIFVVPIAVLLYLLFWRGYNPGLSSLYAVATLFVLMILKLRRLPSRREWSEFVFGSGETLLPLMMIGAGAGVVIGVLNSSGLAFQLAIILGEVGQAWGLIVMLLLTAFIAIILGMGMPTAAVYLILAIVLAPALVEMGIVPIAAHMFLFYFGLLSMLTPPVAVASYVAAGLAGSNMWRTGIIGVQLAAVAYLLPFLWVYNPALLLEGSWQASVYVIATAAIGGWMLARAMVLYRTGGAAGLALAAGLVPAAIAVGGATVWLGPESPLALAAVAAGGIVLLLLRRDAVKEKLPAPAE